MPDPCLVFLTFLFHSFPSAFHSLVLCLGIAYKALLLMSESTRNVVLWSHDSLTARGKHRLGCPREPGPRSWVTGRDMALLASFLHLLPCFLGIFQFSWAFCWDPRSPTTSACKPGFLHEAVRGRVAWDGISSTSIASLFLDTLPRQTAFGPAAARPFY